MIAKMKGKTMSPDKLKFVFREYSNEHLKIIRQMSRVVNLCQFQIKEEELLDFEIDEGLQKKNNDMEKLEMY